MQNSNCRQLRTGNFVPTQKLGIFSRRGILVEITPTFSKKSSFTYSTNSLWEWIGNINFWNRQWQVSMARFMLVNRTKTFHTVSRCVEELLFSEELSADLVTPQNGIPYLRCDSNKEKYNNLARCNNSAATLAAKQPGGKFLRKVNIRPPKCNCQ